MNPHEPNFIFVTPEQMANIDTTHTVNYYRSLAENDNFCVNCIIQPVWRYGQDDLCFYCSTGLTDAGEYYELRPEFYTLPLLNKPEDLADALKRPLLETREVFWNKLAQMGFAMEDCPYTPIDPDWEVCTIVRAIRKTEKELGMVYINPKRKVS